MAAPLIFSTLALVTARLPSEARGTQAEDGQLSWQSAFWALVSIAIGAATQPSGSILGMPPRWGFALKFSPIVCLFNAFEALLCIPLQLRSRPNATTMCHKYARKPADSESELPAPIENNSAIRLVSFILGPVMSATKLFACSGVLYTKILAGCYLASFVCDEAVLNLLWLSGHGAVDAATPSLLRTALSFAPTSNKLQAVERSTHPLPLAQQAAAILSVPPIPDKPWLKDVADLALLASTTFIAHFVSDLVFIAYFLEPNLLEWIDAFVTLVGIVLYAIFSVIKQYRREGLVLALIWVFLFRWCLGTFVVAFFFGMLKDCVTVVSKTPSGTLTLYAQGVPSLLVFAGHVDFIGLLVIGSLRIAHILLGGHKIAFFGGIIPGTNCGASEGSGTRLKALGVGWCLLHFVVALLMYCFTFSPGRTTKPAWTELLG